MLQRKFKFDHVETYLTCSLDVINKISPFHFDDIFADRKPFVMFFPRYITRFPVT
jgi:hypothetical protein